MSDTAKLYLLGGFRLETPEAAPVEIASLKGRALLAYLACIRDHQATREQLSMLLWNEGTGRKPRQNLRQALLKLRRGLAARGLSILLSANGRIALRRDALWVDVWEYDSLAADGRRPALERMDRLYRGEFLHDLSLEAQAFGDWLSERRAHLQDRTLLCLTALIDIHRRTGDINAAIASAHRALEIDPCEELVHRGLMGLYSAQGLRAAALKQYRACAAILRRELDVAPDGATEALYRRLRGGAEELGASPAP